jgi:hypothetical protein
MGSDDFFDHGHKHHKYENKYYHDHDDHLYDQYDEHFDEPSHHFPTSSYKYQILEKLKNNPKIRMLIIVAFLITLILVILVLIMAFPLIVKVVNFISQNGLQGLFDSIWNGKK